MSTPIRQDELSPDDPIFYAPPKWRTGERAAQVPESAGSTGWTAHDDGLPFADAFTKSRRHSGRIEHSRVRITALACAVAVIAWTAFCVTVGLSRIDTPAFAQWRSVPPLAGGSNDSLNERLQAADVAINEVSRQIFPPTLAVADASGLVNSALPLVIKVTNYTPDTTVNLSGLARGTMLSAGSGAGNGQWRVPVDDLPNARVIPPSDYVGPMTVVADSVICGLVARFWVARVRSMERSTSAGMPRTTTPGPSGAPPVGATARCCRILYGLRAMT